MYVLSIASYVYKVKHFVSVFSSSSLFVVRAATQKFSISIPWTVSAVKGLKKSG